MADGYYVCTKCKKKILEEEELGYLGAKDPNDTSCNMLMNLIALCTTCITDTKYEH